MSLSCGFVELCLEVLTFILIKFIFWCYFVLGLSFKHTAGFDLFNLRGCFNRWVDLCSLWLLTFLDLFLPSYLVSVYRTCPLLPCLLLDCFLFSIFSSASLKGGWDISVLLVFVFSFYWSKIHSFLVYSSMSFDKHMVTL